MAHTSVEIVNPGGTGSPAFVISARPDPLPPSVCFIVRLPSAFPLPKKYTYFVGFRLWALGFGPWALGLPTTRRASLFCAMSETTPLRNRTLYSAGPTYTSVGFQGLSSDTISE